MSEIPSEAARTSVADARAANRPVKRWVAFLAALLAAAGWWVSLDLLLLTGGSSASNPLLQAQCGENPDSDCLSVLLSERAYYRPQTSSNRDSESSAGTPTASGSGAANGTADGGASTPASTANSGGGIPWAALGMGYFAFVFLWFLFIGIPARRQRWWHLIIVIVLLVGGIQSLGLLNVMANELKRWCVGCIAVHAINGGLLLLAIAGFPWTRRSERATRQPSPSLAFATLTACVLVFLFHVDRVSLLMRAPQLARLEALYSGVINDPKYVLWRYSNQQRVDIPLRADEVFAGSPDAPNTVVAFVDFQCRACKLAYEQLKRAIERHPGKLRIAYRHFPLDSACNPQQTRRNHVNACRAAFAAETAKAMGGAEAFGRFRNLLYEHQSELDGEPYAQWAGEMKLDAPQFRQMMNSPNIAARITADCEQGKSLGVASVPVIFLNGRRIDGWSNAYVWDLLLDPAATSAPASASP